MVQKFPTKNTIQRSAKVGKVVALKAAKKIKKEKAADELMREAWESTYTNHQIDIERTNKLLLRAWQKTYENRNHRLD
jgi:hypothetical protein